MNKYELLKTYHKLNDELSVWTEILNNTEGSTAHYLDICQEITDELQDVIIQLKQIWAAEKAAQPMRRAA